MSPYRWKISADLIDGSDVGVEGPSNLDPSIETNPKRFEMRDDDGETYYLGTIWGDYDGFEPLDDFGTPHAGCTGIWIEGREL